MVWGSQGYVSPLEAHLLGKVTERRAPSAGQLGRLVRILWIAAVGTGAWAGVSLGRARFYEGRWAATSMLHSWTNLPWALLRASHSTQLTIGIGIILAFLVFLASRQLRQNLWAVCGQICFAVTVAGMVGALTYYLTIFAYDIGPYLGSMAPRYRW